MKKEIFLDAVRKEASALRENLTDLEKSKLDIKTLDVGNPRCCIYGQATGDCLSPRALDLMDKGCIFGIDGGFHTKNNIKNVKYFSEEKGYFKNKRVMYLVTSPIENYITFEEANNENLISYIKGETNTLEL